MDKLRKYRLGKTYKSAFWGRCDIGFDGNETGVPAEPDDELLRNYPENRCEICGDMYVLGYHDSDNVCFYCQT